MQISYGYCYATNRYFANLYGVTNGTVSKWLAHLQEKGYITIEVKRNEKQEVIGRNIYIVDNPYSQKESHPYGEKEPYPYSQKEPYPMVKNEKENNINNNNININNNKESVSVYNNINNNKGKEKEKTEQTTKQTNERKVYANKVSMAETEYNALINKLGEQKTKELIEKLSLYKQSSGKSYYSDYATILKWYKEDLEKEKEKQNKVNQNIKNPTPYPLPNKIQPNYEQREYPPDFFDQFYANNLENYKKLYGEGG